MKPGSMLLEPSSQPRSRTRAAPVFLVDLPPWHQIFLRNLSDLFRPARDSSLHLYSRPRLILDGRFRLLSPSLEAVCSVCPVSRRGGSGPVGIGATMAAKPAGAGSPRLQSRRRNLLRSFGVSSAARYGRHAPAASAQRRTRARAPAHHFGTGRGGQSQPDHRHTVSPQAESRCASAQYRRLVAARRPAYRTAGIDHGSGKTEAAGASGSSGRARAGYDSSRPPAGADAFADRHSSSSRSGHGVFAHTPGATGGDCPTSAKRRRHFAPPG